MTRRAFLLVPLLVPARAEAASVHVEGVLKPDTGAGDGYYSLCGVDACHPTDAIGFAVHPKGAWAEDFQSLVYQPVQVSIFRP